MPITEDEKIQADIFWKMYQENVTHARHQETQRSTVANVILVIAAGLITAIGLNKSIDIADSPLACLLIALGIFGLGFSSKHYERYQVKFWGNRRFLPCTECELYVTS